MDILHLYKIGYAKAYVAQVGSLHESETQLTCCNVSAVRGRPVLDNRMEQRMQPLSLFLI